MASSEDFQSIYELYKKQCIPNGISIVKFCQQNGVVYSQFDRWFKSRNKTAKSSVHPVQIVDKDGLMGTTQQADVDDSGEKDTETLNGPFIAVRYNRPDQSRSFHPTEQFNLPAAAMSGGEVGGFMLAITGGVTLWYVSSVTNMRYGKYRLFAEVEFLGNNPYNGDAYLFLSKNRQTLKIIRFKNHKRLLYDVTYEKGYKFLQPVYKGNILVYELDFKYLAALLECPVIKSISV